MYYLIATLIVLIILLPLFFAVKNRKNLTLAKKAVRINLSIFIVMMALCLIVPLIVSAADTNDTNTTGVVSSATEPNTDNTTIPTASNNDSAVGMAFLATALVTGLSGIGGGIAVASAAPAAIGATSENPKVFSKALIFVALGESIAIYGLVISILLFSKLPSLV